jgi:RNA polymerase sigma factor (sigma-70 family)
LRLIQHLPYEDKALLLLVAEGDEQAFRRLFDLYEEKIFSLALKITKSEVIAEELLQDVFLSIWLKREQLKEIEDFPSYLFIVARNKGFVAIKRIARNRNRSLPLAPEAPFYHNETEESISVNEYHTVIRQAIGRLSPHQRQAYQLIKEQGLTREQASVIMQVGPETVKTHLNRAIKFIRAWLLAHFELALTAFFLIWK